MRVKTKIVLLLIGILPLIYAQSALELRDQAQRSMREEDYIRAASLLRQSLRLNPNYREANEDLALVLFFLGEDLEAERYARQAVRLAGNRGMARLLLARVLLRKGPESLPEVEMLLNSALQEDGASSELYNTYAALEIIRKRLPFAIRFYEQSLNRQPNQLHALLASFMLEDNLGNRVRAEQLLDRLLRIHGIEPAVLEQATKFYHKIGNFDQATVMSDRLINLVVNWGYPEAFIRAVHDRARLDLTQNRLRPEFNLDRTVQLVQTAIQRDPSQAISFALLATLLLRQNKVTDAQAAYRLALERQKDDETLRLSWERSVRQLNLDNPVRQEPARFYAQQAESLLSRNLIDQAREAYRRLLRLDPYDRGARWGLAKTWQDLGFPAMYLGGLLDIKAVQTQVRPATRRLSNEADRELERELDYWFQRWFPERTLAGSWRLNWDTYRYWRDPSTWNLNQPGRGGRPTRLAVFLIGKTHHLEGFPDQIETYLETFSDLLLSQISPWPKAEGHGRIGVLPLTLLPIHEQTGALDLGQARVNTIEEAIERSRRLGADFFLTVDFSNSDSLFLAEAELKMGSTGRPIQNFSSSRQGAERIIPALRDLVQKIHQYLPVRATLAARRELLGKSLALIPLGSLHGLKVDDELWVIKSDSLSLKPEFPFLQWPESARIATIKLSAVDDWMAEGEINHLRGQDMTRVADSVVFLRQNPDLPPSNQFVIDNLANQILSIR